METGRGKIVGGDEETGLELKVKRVVLEKGSEAAQ